MRTVLALLLVTAACAGRPHNTRVVGPVIGQSTAPGPSDPSRPVAVDPPDVTEGGGRLTGPVGSAPGSVTPTVGEQPSTIDQAKSSNTAGSTGDQQPATVYAPTVGGTVVPTTPAPATNRAPATPSPTGAPVPPATGPITGAGPNGPGTGTGPATPLGPATGTNTPTPSTPNPR
jgi:hypothetical protein